MNGFSAEPGERSARVMSIQPPGAVEPGRADRGAHGAAPGLDHQDRRPRRPAPWARGGGCGERLQAALQVGVEGGEHRGLVARRGAGELAGRVPGERREAAAGPAAGSAAASSARGRAIRPARTMRVEHPGAGRARRGRMAVRPARLGRLRQGDQQRLLAVGQALRLVAEVGEAGGAHALQIAAVGRQRQVERQHLALGEPRLQLQRARHLDRAWPPKVRRRGSSRRAVCMVSVEAPEVMRPRSAAEAAARIAETGSTPGCSQKRPSSSATRRRRKMGSVRSRSARMRQRPCSTGNARSQAPCRSSATGEERSALREIGREGGVEADEDELDGQQRDERDGQAGTVLDGRAPALVVPRQIQLTPLIRRLRRHLLPQGEKGRQRTRPPARCRCGRRRCGR